MKYYVIEIQRDAQGQEAKGIFDYESRNAANSAFYSKMASGTAAVDAGTLSFIMCMVMNEMGNIEDMKRCSGTVEPEEV